MTVLPLQVLDNGLLIGPHDHESVADALLKLVADKQLWSKCRANGLRNIHLFSWTQHCKTYLSRIASCKPRHPGWLKNNGSDDDDDNSEPESSSDSLRDMHDISLNLKFSLDGANSEDRKTKLENAVLSYSKGNIVKTASRTVPGEKSDQAKFPALRRRNHIFVITVDADNIKNLFVNVKKVFEAVEKEKNDGSVGFIPATSLQMAEIHSFMVSNGINSSDFDAFICNNGADLYYSSSHLEDNPFVFDLYYNSHIEYRCGDEGLRKTLVRWASSVIDKNAKNKKEEHVVTEDEVVSTNYCYAFNVRNPALELRKIMRIQALRCHVIYCQNGRKINVIPVLASRSQALRYLYLRWGMDLTKVVFFVGESGDTDYEVFLGGFHKSVILKGVGNTNDQLKANRIYPLSDVWPKDRSNIIQTPDQFSVAGIRGSLVKLGVLKG